MENQVAFLQDVALIALHYEHDSALAKRCDRLREVTERGQSPLPLTATMKEIDNFVMYNVTHPIFAR